MSPEVGLSSPAISRISEVLPASVGPSRMFSEPFSSRIDTERIWVPCGVSLVTSISSSMALPFTFGDEYMPISRARRL
jgi:hypothetical protein